MTDGTMTQTTFLALKVIERTSCDWFTAVEAVSSTLLAHPEWETDERFTYPEWEIVLEKRGTTT